MIHVDILVMFVIMRSTRRICAVLVVGESEMPRVKNAHAEHSDDRPSGKCSKTSVKRKSPWGIFDNEGFLTLRHRSFIIPFPSPTRRKPAEHNRAYERVWMHDVLCM